MSDTPRTDAAIWNREDRSWMDGSLCRQLERELAAATKERDEALARIKRLEEAGDALANNHNPFTFIDWIKVKEAKS